MVYLTFGCAMAFVWALMTNEFDRGFELFHLQILRWFDPRNFMFHCGMLQL